MNNPRFQRTEALLGAKAMQKLSQVTVMIVGLGAVGGYALEALARAGVGHLILVDFDTFEPSNINRQILALSSTLGQKKTLVAQKRVAEINPDCEVKLEDIFLTNENINILLNQKVDFVVDAIDTISAKCALMKALAEKKIPFISSMGAALKKDISAVRVAKLSETKNCTMARKVRQSLKKCGVQIENIDCVFSAEESNLPENAISPNPAGGKSILGSMPTITAVFGLTMAHFVILKLVGASSHVANA